MRRLRWTLQSCNCGKTKALVGRCG
jgi:hypothetical protein